MPLSPGRIVVQVESNPEWFLAALRTQWGRIRHAHATTMRVVQDDRLVESEGVVHELRCSCREEPLGRYTQTREFVDGWPDSAMEVAGLWADNLYWRHALNVLLEM